MGFKNIQENTLAPEEFFVQTTYIKWKSRSGVKIIFLLLILHWFWLIALSATGAGFLIVYLLFFLPILIAFIINEKLLLPWVRKLIFWFGTKQKIKKIFNRLPVIDFGDYWYLQESRNDKNFNNIIPDQLNSAKIFDFLIWFPASVAVVGRLYSWLAVENNIISNGNANELVLIVGLLLGPMLFITIWVPIWVLEDSGFKVVSVAGWSSKSNSDLSQQISSVGSLAGIFRALVAYPIGIGSFVWLRDNVSFLLQDNGGIASAVSQMGDNSSLLGIIISSINNTFQSYLLVIVVIILLLFLLLGPLYLAYLIYLSRYHTQAINNFRREVLIY